MRLKRRRRKSVKEKGEEKEGDEEEQEKKQEEEDVEAEEVEKEQEERKEKEEEKKEEAEAEEVEKEEEEEYLLNTSQTLFGKRQRYIAKGGNVFSFFGLLFSGFCSNKGMDLHLHPSKCISLYSNSVLVWDSEATRLNICKS